MSSITEKNNQELVGYRYDLNIQQYSLIASIISKKFKDVENNVNIYEIGSRDCADAFLLCTLLRDKLSIKINCFDPNKLFNLLSKPFLLACNDIRAFNYALSDVTEKKIFYDTNTSENNTKVLNDFGIGASSLKEPEKNIDNLPTKTFETVLVDCFRGDEIINQIGDPDVLILDVQGSELDVLKGFGNNLYLPKLIFLECNIVKNRLYKHDSALNEVDNYLKLHGFRIIKAYNVSKYSCDCVYAQAKDSLIFTSIYALLKLKLLHLLKTIGSKFKSIFMKEVINA